MDLSFRISIRLARLGALEERLLPKEPFRRLLLLDRLRIVCIVDVVDVGAVENILYIVGKQHFGCSVVHFCVVVQFSPTGHAPRRKSKGRPALLLLGLLEYLLLRVCVPLPAFLWLLFVLNQLVSIGPSQYSDRLNTRMCDDAPASACHKPAYSRDKA